MNDTTRATTALKAIGLQLPQMEDRDMARKIERTLGLSTHPMAMVELFHEVYEVPRARSPQVLGPERLRLRLELIREEVAELVEAAGVTADYESKCGEQNIPEMADALGDIIYVCCGMAIEMGIDLRFVMAEIQASNMSKLDQWGMPIINRCRGGDEGVEDDPCSFEGKPHDHKCDKPSHRINPTQPVGKVLKGPNYHPPQIAKILGLTQVAKQED